ncbi:MAG: hypothetical protein HC923_11055, partial [Myxococcales bacterium]|nr:hypothetical protein [Myxococcales bacterium]
MLEHFAPSTTVELTAMPGAARRVRAWTGDCAATDRSASCTLAMLVARTAGVEFVDFFRVPLDADMGCQVGLRFEGASPLQNACAGAGTVTSSGTWSVVASRTNELGSAYRPAVEGSALTVGALLPAPPRITLELTLRRTGDAFAGAGEGVLFSDRAPSTGRGIELRIGDDGSLVLVTFETQ